jgi:hypothetical protein
LLADFIANNKHILIVLLLKPFTHKKASFMPMMRSALEKAITRRNTKVLCKYTSNDSMLLLLLLTTRAFSNEMFFFCSFT